MKKILAIFVAISAIYLNAMAEEPIIVGPGAVEIIDSQSVYNNIIVNGGELIVRNSSYVEGNITVNEGGDFTLASNSIITGDVVVNWGTLVDIGGLVAINGNLTVDKATTVRLISVNNVNNVDIDQTSTFSLKSGSKVAFDLTVRNTSQVDITSSEVYGNFEVSKCGQANIVSITGIWHANFSDNDLVVSVANEVEKNLKANNNTSLFMDSTVEGLSSATETGTKGTVSQIFQNIETRVYNSTFNGNVIVMPSPNSTLCEFVNNTYSKLTGGCY